tara:strand:- start:2419 stop:3567 length:1149 start_codon:yes stop_codon:yes gene_type:complete
MGIFFLTIIYFVSERFFDLVEIYTSHSDLVLLTTIMIIPLSIGILFNKNFYSSNKNLIKFFIYCFVGSIITASINFSQSFSAGFSASRVFLTYCFLMITLYKFAPLIKPFKLFNFVSFVSLFLVVINFYIYSTGNYSFYYGNVLDRFEDIRFLIGGTSIIYFYLYLISFKDVKATAIPISILLLLVVAIVAKTRSLLFPLLFITIIHFVDLSRFKNLLQIIFSILFISFLSIFLRDTTIWTSLYDLYELSINDIEEGGGNITFRLFTLIYFFENMTPLSWIFGYGMEIDKLALYDERFYLSDVGMFKIFYYHGIVGLYLFFSLLYEIYKESRKNNSPFHVFARYLIYFQFLSPTLTILYTPTGIFIFLLTFFKIRQINESNI